MLIIFLRCWAYPGYAIFGADANPNDHSSSTFIEWRTSFGLHAIISSPLILSFDVTSNDTDGEFLPSIPFTYLTYLHT